MIGVGGFNRIVNRAAGAYVYVGGIIIVGCNKVRGMVGKTKYGRKL